MQHGTSIEKIIPCTSGTCLSPNLPVPSVYCCLDLISQLHQTDAPALGPRDQPKIHLLPAIRNTHVRTSPKQIPDLPAKCQAGAPLPKVQNSRTRPLITSPNPASEFRAGLMSVPDPKLTVLTNPACQRRRHSPHSHYFFLRNISSLIAGRPNICSNGL
jgi:hypothetical protein